MLEDRKSIVEKNGDDEPKSANVREVSIDQELSYCDDCVQTILSIRSKQISEQTVASIMVNTGDDLDQLIPLEGFVNLDCEPARACIDCGHQIDTQDRTSPNYFPWEGSELLFCQSCRRNHVTSACHACEQARMQKWLDDQGSSLGRSAVPNVLADCRILAEGLQRHEESPCRCFQDHVIVLVPREDEQTITWSVMVRGEASSIIPLLGGTMAIVLGCQDLECSLQDAMAMIDLFATRLAAIPSDGDTSPPSPAFALTPEAVFSFGERVQECQTYRDRTRSDGGFKAACAARAARIFHTNGRPGKEPETTNTMLDDIGFMAFPTRLHNFFTIINEFITFARANGYRDAAVLDLACTSHDCPGQGPDIVLPGGNILSIHGNVQQLFGTVCLLEHRGQWMAFDLFDLPGRVIRSGGSIEEEGTQTSISLESIESSRNKASDHAVLDAGPLDARDRSLIGTR
jgi:predicted RNA-binding Zn-ribbon protein involved in translation (DUF1610 family)